MAQCTKARLAPAGRPCWQCNKKGHTSANCPDKTRKPGAVRSVDDAAGRVPIFGLGGIGGEVHHIDHEGFQQVRRGGRPQPRPAVLGDFINENIFAAIAPAADALPTPTTGPMSLKPPGWTQPPSEAVKRGLHTTGGGASQRR